jgi:hypothetical protein
MPRELQVSVITTWSDDVPVFAFFAGRLVFATIGVIQMIRVRTIRTKWTWRHINLNRAIGSTAILGAWFAWSISALGELASRSFNPSRSAMRAETYETTPAIAIVTNASQKQLGGVFDRHRDERSLVEH